jgi:uncharacterized protein (DUF111 family)
MGAGKRAYQRPTFLRVMLIEQQEQEHKPIIKLETNVDDCTGEALGHVMNRLMEAGARDVFFTPIYMKKNRPGYLLSVICCEEQRKQMETIIFQETTTIGIRCQSMDRAVLDRRQERVTTELGDVTFKCVQTPEGERRYPEYESIAEICRSTGRSFQSVLHQILRDKSSN